MRTRCVGFIVWIRVVVVRVEVDFFDFGVITFTFVFKSVWC